MLRNRDVSGLTNSSNRPVPPIKVTEPTRTINRQSLTQQSFNAQANQSVASFKAPQNVGTSQSSLVVQDNDVSGSNQARLSQQKGILKNTSQRGVPVAQTPQGDTGSEIRKPAGKSNDDDFKTKA